MTKFCFSTIHFACLAVLVSSALTGCVDLSGSGHVPPARKKTPVVAKIQKTQARQYTKKDGEVHTMLGGLGLFSKGMYGLRDAVHEEYHIAASSSMWYNAGDVTRKIERYYYAHNPHRPIILIGHSLGANEQIKVARNLNRDGIPVDLLVTVDAVSQTIVPPNVKYALNMYKPGYVPMFSGLKLRAVDSQKTHIENVNVATLKGISVNHFTIDKDEAVQAVILNKVGDVLKKGSA